MANANIYARDADYGTKSGSSIGSIMQGSSGMVLLFTLKDTGGTAIALTGYTVTGKIESPTGTVAAITGATAVTANAADGEFGWTVASADTGTDGVHKVWFTFIKASNPTYVSFPAGLAIVDDPAVDATFSASLVGVSVTQAAWLGTAVTNIQAGTNGNFAGIDGSGSLVDSGSAAADFDAAGSAAAAQAASLPRNQIVVSADGDYSTVGAALAAAVSGDVILADASTAEATATLTIPAGVTVRILPGRTVQYSGSDVVFLATDSTSRLFDGIGEIVLFPSAWTWVDHGLLIRKNSRGGYEVGEYPDVSVWDFPASPNIAYVDGVVGNNASAGTTWATAKKGVRYAFAMSPQPDIVFVRAGIYSDGDQAWAAWNLQKSCAIIGVGGKAVISYHKNATDAAWALDGTYTNTYAATIANVISVYDALYEDVNGDYSPLTLAASAAAVDATPGTYFYSGGVLYIRLRDSRVPDDYVRPYRDAQYTARVTNVDVRLENVDLHGGASALSYQTGGRLYAKNCTIKYSRDNGADFFGTLAILDNVACVGTGDDGLNYKKGTGAAPKVIEINCRTTKNGVGIAETLNNGSTMHDGGQIIRVNGNYQESGGRVVHDIGEGTNSLNVGCAAGQSSSQTNGASAGLAATTETCAMWLIGCDLAGSEYDADAVSANSAIYYHDTAIKRSRGSGNVTAW